ncbi:ATP-binding protein [Streptomyces sp. NPDC048508]|uniref:ATP-binding protein n=1 Tax=Streptomyces sp. NPDC048508 TaxID=3365561 RepID=UPI00371835E3
MYGFGRSALVRMSSISHGGWPHTEIDLIGLDSPQDVACQVVRQLLAGKVDEKRTDDVIQVAIELVNEAVARAGEALSIRVDIHDWGVVIQVCDSGEGSTAVTTQPSVANGDFENGRGVLRVHHLASAWRVQSDMVGRRVVAILLYRTGELA